MSIRAEAWLTGGIDVSRQIGNRLSSQPRDCVSAFRIDAYPLRGRFQPSPTAMHGCIPERSYRLKFVLSICNGLAAWLLGMREPASIATHAMRGALFESFVVGEFVKQRFHAGQPAELYFWRDNVGHEVDLLFEVDGGLQAVEIKSGMTFAQDWPAAARRWTSYAGKEALPPWIIYGGERGFDVEGCRVFSWRALCEDPNA